jgi:expansin (peptidoglycan-binding protein)
MNASTLSGIITAGTAVIVGLLFWLLPDTVSPTCEVTWYHAKDHTVAVNPRHKVPDGAYILFTNRATVPQSVVIVRKRGHMNPKAKADFDLCPEAFKQLAPLDEGRLKEVEWRVIYP